VKEYVSPHIERLTGRGILLKAPVSCRIYMFSLDLVGSFLNMGFVMTSVLKKPSRSFPRSTILFLPSTVSYFRAYRTFYSSNRPKSVVADDNC
jgi:hypothetical protein